MSNREKLMHLASQLPEELAGEVLSFAEFLDTRRKRQAFEEWEATCPEEEVSPDLAARLDAAREESDAVPAEDVYREAGLT